MRKPLHPSPSRSPEFTAARSPELWSDPNPHQLMLQDKKRTLAFKRAIEGAAAAGKTVADLGCGSGIMSLFAATRGCKKVYAVDNAACLSLAEETALRNGLQDRIEFVSRDMFRFVPPKKVDVAIHEHIGEYIWDEGMLEKLRYIRTAVLRKQGCLIPAGLKLFMAPVSFTSRYLQSLGFWKAKRLGLDFSAVGELVRQQLYEVGMLPSLLNLEDTQCFLCRAKQVHSMDFYQVQELPGNISVSFKVRREQVLTGMCMYFSVSTDSRHTFSTKPGNTDTSWGQIYIPAESPIPMKGQARLSFALFPQENPMDWKWEFDVG